MAPPTLEQQLATLQSESRVAGLFHMAAGYAQTGSQLPQEVVRAIRFVLRGYPHP